LQQEVARLAASPEVRSAFNWFRTQEPQLAQWQMEMARIPAPPFGESARAAWLAERFREVGLDDVRIDDVGNVFGTHPGFGRRYVALSAHIDTVFPANTPLNIRQQGSRIYGPGVSDNGAGVAAMLAIARCCGRCASGMRCRSCSSAMWAKRVKATCAACGTFFRLRAGRIRLPTAWCSTAPARTRSWPKPWAAAASK
jgi:hypothetical protein